MLTYDSILIKSTSECKTKQLIFFKNVIYFHIDFKLRVIEEKASLLFNFNRKVRFMKKKLSTATKIIFVYIAAQLLPLPLMFLFPENRQIEMSLNLTILFAFLGTIGMVLLNRTKEWTPSTELTDKPSAPTKKIVLWGLIGFVGSIVLQIVTSLIETAVFNVSSESVNTQTLLDIASDYPFLIFMIVLFAPIMEEFVFRKAIFAQLSSSSVGIVGSAVISSLLFAFIHFDGHMLVYGSLGLWFCYLYFKTNNIFTPIMAHALMNAYASLPLYFPELFQ